MLRTRLAAAFVGFAVLTSPGLHAADKPGAVALTTLDGMPTTLDAVRGKAATVIVFLSGECPVSNSYVAPLNDLAKAVGDKGVAVLAVCPTDDPADRVTKWAAEFKVGVPVYLDPKKEAERIHAGG